MHAGTPILSNRLTEIERFILKYDIGIVNDDITPEGISKSIMSIKNNPVLIKHLSENCIKAAQKENWDIEKLKLIDAIES